MRAEATKNMINIENLVGDISESDLKHVDYYFSKDLGIFIPSVGFCQYAIQPKHTHPAYSFVLFFSKDQSITPVKLKLLPEHYLATAMAPNVPHEEKETETFTRYIAIFISQELYETIHSEYSSSMPEKYFWEQFQIEHEIMFYLKKFMSEYENKLSGYKSLLDFFGRAITHQIIRSILKIHKPADFITEKFEIEKTIEFMHQHFGEKLTIAELAKNANMSESHFTRTFKKETALAPIEFLIKIRIAKAKKLLRSRTTSITQVSLQCGFNSTSHFSSSFTKHLGITPSEYLKSYTDY